MGRSANARTGRDGTAGAGLRRNWRGGCAGSRVTCEGSERDRYGRLVATCAATWRGHCRRAGARRGGLRLSQILAALSGAGEAGGGRGHRVVAGPCRAARGLPGRGCRLSHRPARLRGRGLRDQGQHLGFGPDLSPAGAGGLRRDADQLRARASAGSVRKPRRRRQAGGARGAERSALLARATTGAYLFRRAGIGRTARHGKDASWMRKSGNWPSGF